jgi:hypothetical protein
VETDVLIFVKSCVKRRRLRWTYHINMRLKGRFIPREAILSSVDAYEIIEEYPGDKYLPSYLVYTEYESDVIHVLMAIDLANDVVTIITAYRPDREEWERDLRTRRRR